MAVPPGPPDRGRAGDWLGVPRVVHGRAWLGADGPSELVADLYEHLVAAGADLGLRQAGSFAFEAARLERGFRAWGHDLGPLDDPFAAGLGFTVSRRKAADYLGRAALDGLRETKEPERRLVSVHAPNAVLWHGESMLRDGERVGFVSSASIAPTLGGSVGLAWIHGPVEGEWQVEVGAGRSLAASASTRSTTRAASGSAADGAVRTMNER